MNLLTRAGAWARLIGRFFIDLALSVKEVVLAVFDPGRASNSGIVAVPLDVHSEAGIALLANMITLTPGTTSLHVSEDGKTLYMHVMNLSDDTVEQVKAGFERHVRRVLP